MKKHIRLCCSILLCISMSAGLLGCSHTDKPKKADDKRQENIKHPERKKSESDAENWLKITYQTVGTEPSEQDMKDTIYKLQKRAEEYTAKARVYQKGSRRIIVELAGIPKEDKERLYNLGKPGELVFLAEDESGEPAKEVITGKDVADAQPGTQKIDTGEKDYMVQLTLTSEGAEKFGKATADNIGKKIYIMYDGRQISDPVVQAAIYDGKPVITGMESYEAAEELAALLRIGSLTLELEEIDSNIG